MDQEAIDFLNALEAKRGAPVTWRTFCTWYGTNSGTGTICEWGVFLYRSNGKFWFEDFEHIPTLFGFSLPKSKKRREYIKYESSIAPESIKVVKTVTIKQAEAVCRHLRSAKEIKGANLFNRMFSRLVEMVVLEDGTVHCFELIDRKAFLAQLKEHSR